MIWQLVSGLVVFVLVAADIYFLWTRNGYLAGLASFTVALIAIVVIILAIRRQR